MYVLLGVAVFAAVGMGDPADLTVRSSMMIARDRSRFERPMPPFNQGPPPFAPGAPRFSGPPGYPSLQNAPGQFAPGPRRPEDRDPQPRRERRIFNFP